MTAHATVVVRRTPPGGLGDQYPITVWLDGERLGSLMPGQSLTRDVSPGAHELRANNTLLSKRHRFEAVAGEAVRLVTLNRAGWGTMFFALLGAGPLSLVIAPEGDAPDAQAAG